MKTKDAGELLLFTFVKDLMMPYSYAYGIRVSSRYGAHFIRTSPVARVDHDNHLIYTVFTHYRFDYFIDDTTYQELLFNLFSDRVTPPWEDELIISPVYFEQH